MFPLECNIDRERCRYQTLYYRYYYNYNYYTKSSTTTETTTTTITTTAIYYTAVNIASTMNRSASTHLSASNMVTGMMRDAFKVQKPVDEMNPVGEREEEKKEERDRHADRG